MLKGIPPLLGPQLLGVLRAMGHGDEIAIVDANYPAASAGPTLVRSEGASATDIADAVLSVLPLDSFVDQAAFCMQVVDAPERREPIMEDFAALIARHEPGFTLGTIERFAFYARAKMAFAIVQTGERRLYGNLILKKGVVASAS